MPRSRISLLLLLLLTGCQAGSSIQPIEVKGIQELEEVLLPLDTLSLPGLHALRDISQLEVRPSDHALLVVDKFGGTVHLLDASGHLVRPLQAQECTPGFTQRAYEAHFAPDGRILVLYGASLRGFWFTSDGTCQQPLEHLLKPPPDEFAFREAGYFYGLVTNPEGFFIRKYRYDGSEVEDFPTHTRYAGLVQRWDDKKLDRYQDVLVLVNPFTFEVHRYPPDTKEPLTHVLHMPGLRRMDLPEDVRAFNPEDVLEFMTHIRHISVLGTVSTRSTPQIFLSVSHMYTRPRPTHFLIVWSPDQPNAKAYRAPEWLFVSATLIYGDTLYVPRLEETDTDARWKLFTYRLRPDEQAH